MAEANVSELLAHDYCISTEISDTTGNRTWIRRAFNLCTKHFDDASHKLVESTHICETEFAQWTYNTNANY